jgi:muramoyltetrapeptide carboxypeptidase
MPSTIKPPALRPADNVRVLSLASPVDQNRLASGVYELARLGYTPQFDPASVLASEGFFAGSQAVRAQALTDAFRSPYIRAVICSRGGYGANYLLPAFPAVPPPIPRIFVGYSDATSVALYLWKWFRWVTFYGPMVAAGLDHGAGNPRGYDSDSFSRALTERVHGWSIPLDAEALTSGGAEGILLGGCLTLLETSIGTEWEIDAEGAILVLEDRGMKPWQVDRALMHLLHAGRFRGVTGVLLGDFPECDPPAGTESVRDVIARVLAPLGIPIVFGAPIGHTARPMLTLPLGVRAHLTAGAGSSGPQLEILEPAVS